MRILEKITLVLYSIIILVIAVVSSMVVFGWLSLDAVEAAILSYILK